MNHEAIFLGGCFNNAELIDEGITEGCKPESFTSPAYKLIWQAMVEAKSKGSIIDLQNLLLANGQNFPLAEAMECENACHSTTTARKALKKLIWEAQKRAVKPALTDIVRQIDQDAKPEEIVKAVEALQGHLKPAEEEAKSLDAIIGEVELWAKQEVEGTRPNVDIVYTGLPTFDRYAGGIEPHEYVVVGARTSHGKSSFMAQIAGHNLNRGLRVAMFTLETSSGSVVKQIAGQRSKINLRQFAQEDKAKLSLFHVELSRLKKQGLRVYDKDLSLQQIESRCRILAASWKPQLVLIDYMGLMKGTDKGSSYERMGQLSKAMIPLRKSLGCALIVAAQLNRGNEKEDRAPTRTDFRDAGSIEEDASRVICLYRPSKGFNGQEQGLGQQFYDYELLQLKLRDGPLADAKIRLHAPSTVFFEPSELQ